MGEPFRLLVCGGRDYDDRWRVFRVLDSLARKRPGLIVIHGCALGADAMAGEWARERGHLTQEYPADWQAHGRAAGPIRNGLMLSDGKPDGAVAFPGGRGTADMVKRIRAAGVKLLDLRDPVRTATHMLPPRLTPTPR